MKTNKTNENPFYHNYLFSKEDLKRTVFKWYQYPILWFLPMKVQITTDGVAYFKVWNGAYYFYGFNLEESVPYKEYAHQPLFCPKCTIKGWK